MASALQELELYRKVRNRKNRLLSGLKWSMVQLSRMQMREILAGLMSKCFKEVTLNLGPTGTLISRENKWVGRTAQIGGTPRGASHQP